MHAPHPFSEVDQRSVDTLRFLSIDAVQKANSGHPGLPLDAAPMAYVLWTRFLKHHPANPQWFDRDRFVLSAGHGSALLYSLLHLSGYDLPMAQLLAPFQPAHGRFTEAGFVGIYGRRGGRMPGAEADFAVA